MTIHELVADLSKELQLSPEQQFRITAKIKRYVHFEKWGLCLRLKLYSELGKNRKAKGRRARNKVTLSGLRFMQETLEAKVETHSKMANMSDEQIVTWNVGSHKFTQERKPGFFEKGIACTDSGCGTP